MKTIKKRTEISLIKEFILNFERDVVEKKKKNKRFSLVLTGGRSPIKLYRELAKSGVDWSNVDLFWGDERYVPHSSKNSNYKLAYDNLIKKIKINKKNLYPINIKKKLISECAKNYLNKIKKYFKNENMSFDCFLLGMGIDGHVASIFPESINIKKKLVTTIRKKDFNRISMSLKIINKSQKIILWLNNKLKTERYNQLKFKGNKIPVNNLDKRKTVIFQIS